MKKSNQKIVLNPASKFIPCKNTELNDSVYWFGRYCNNFSVKVDFTTKSVICGTCVAIITAPGDPALLTNTKGKNYPRGWKLYGEFVDSDGNVFFKGVEQIYLKGTKEPSVIEKIIKVKKIRETGINKNAEKIRELKKQLKETVDNNVKKTLNLEINKLTNKG